jgi:hypothetical protein
MKELTNGTKLVCHVPHIAPQAWLHYIYKGLSIEQIEEFEKKFPVAFPSEYKEFLKESNGINVFSDSLSIWGLRNSYERTGDGAIQPYDILALNNERPKGCPNTWLFFGSYSWDGTRLLFDLANGDGSNKVYRCARRSTQILQEWPSFWVWFDSEVERIGKLFDSNGIKYDKKISTAPNFLD